MAKRLEADAATLCYDPLSRTAAPLLPIVAHVGHMTGSSNITFSLNAPHLSQLLEILTTEFELVAI